MESIVFKNKGQEIFGILHMPKTEKKVPLVVFCHGWSGNHLGTWNAFFANAGRELVKQGFAVLRFDFRGSGNSTGKFEDQTITSMLSDLKAVIDQTVKRQGIDKNRIALVGHSQGAYVALFHTAKDKRIKAFISWMGRLSDYKDYVSKVEIGEAKRRGFLPSWDGYTVRYNTYVKDTFKYHSDSALRRLKLPIGFLYGEADTIVPISEGERARKLAKGKTEMKILKDLTHDFTGKPGIQKEVLAITTKWLRRWL